jgi:cytochrome c oxidase subunit II
MRVFVDTPPSILDPHGSEADHLANVWWIMLGIAAFVYLVVGGFIILAAFRGRKRVPVEGSTRHDQYFIWIGGVIVPTAILMFVAFLTVHTGAALRAPSEEPLSVHVIGKQWWWQVEYPGTRVVTANEIHVPVGQPLEVQLDSDNVVHSFWVPQLAGKVDMIPGQRNTLRFTIRAPGQFRGECAEYCGLQHARMNLRVIAESPGDFTRWLTHEEQITSIPGSELAARGQLAFTSSACAGCHTVRGTSAQGTVGPDLTDVGARARLGAETVDNTPDNLRTFIADPSRFKPGVHMPPATISDDDINAVAEYLQGLR